MEKYLSRVLSQTRKLHLPLSFLRLSSSLLFFILSYSITAQQLISFSNGQGEFLVGVEVYSPDYKFTDVSNDEGLINVPAGISEIICRYLGYEEKQVFVSNITDIQEVELITQEVLVDGVTIVGRTGVVKEEIPYQVETISKKQIQLLNTQTAADALAAHANVYVQKSQLGGGSPVLRGFEANKILLVIDGVRLNNAIYRSGHLQNAITIDQAVLEQMEVIFGAGSLNYGSDALGGVIHFKSQEPRLVYDDSRSYLEHGFYLRRATANLENSIHYDLKYGNKKWASLTSVTFSDYEDLVSGNVRTAEFPEFGERPDYIATVAGVDTVLTNPQPSRQIGTGYNQLDLLQKLVFQPSNISKITLNGQYSTSTDVPRYDRLTERSSDGNLKFAEWFYGPQKRLLLSGKLDCTKANSLFDRALVIASYQKIDEDRIDRQFQSDLRAHQEEDVNVYGLTVDFSKSISEDNRHVLKYGIDFQHNDVLSEAFEEDIRSGSINTNVLTRYPSDFGRLTNYGVFGTSTWKSKSERLITNIGLRYNATNIALRYKTSDPFPWPQNFTDGLSNTNSALVGSIGANYNTDNKWQLHGQLATAFRSPNIDDIAKNRIKDDEVSVPNLELNPERSINAELGFTKRGKHNNFFQLAGYYTILNDAIVREALPLPDGSTFIVDGIDTLTTVGNVNADKGFIYGFTTSASLKLIDKLSWNGSFNYTFGRAEDENGTKPLAHIPPIFGRTGLDWSYEKFTVSAIMRFNGKKDILDFEDSTDNPEQATEEGSLAWQTYNIYMSYPYFDWLNLSIGVENILNTHYRNFSSGVSAPGMNFIITLRGTF